MTEQQPSSGQTPSPQNPAQANLAPHRGVLILVLGILGIVCCIICGIVAWVMGNNDLKKMADGVMDPSGQGLTTAGKICGIVGVVLQIIGIVVWLLTLVIGGGSAFLNP